VLLLLSSSIHAVAITPAEPRIAFRSLHLGQRPSPIMRWVGFRIIIFEACSTFTHVTACTCDFRFNPATDSDLIPATVPI
jgi:hypothetical protein